MLQIDWGEADLSNSCVLLLNSVESIDIAVVTLNVVDLRWVIEVFAVVQDLELGLGVLLRTKGSQEEERQ